VTKQELELSVVWNVQPRSDPDIKNLSGPSTLSVSVCVSTLHLKAGECISQL